MMLEFDHSYHHNLYVVIKLVYDDGNTWNGLILSPVIRNISVVVGLIGTKLSL